MIFDTLKSMDHYKSVKGRLALYKMVIEQIDIDQPLLVGFCVLGSYLVNWAQVFGFFDCSSLRFFFFFD